jgi:N-sulfoglucosamine sulfohydrolase
LNHFQTHEHIDTIPALFNAAGYQTGLIGKVHVGPRSAYPWETFEPRQSRDAGWNAERVGAFMDKALGTRRPFHVTAAFRDPHGDNTRDGWGNNDHEVKPFAVPDYNEDEVITPEFLADVPELRMELVEYYKSIGRLDIGVGEIIHEMKSRELESNTMVVFLSDNGAPFVNSKTTLYDAGVKLPFIVKVPGRPAGAVNLNLVSFRDLVPTSSTGEASMLGLISTQAHRNVKVDPSCSFSMPHLFKGTGKRMFLAPTAPTKYRTIPYLIHADT